MPWGPNLMGELPLTCVGLDRACCCFSTRSLQAWRTEKFHSHMRSSELGVRVRSWCDPLGGGSRAGGAEPPWVVGTGHRKDALLDAGCSTAASRSCTTWRHRDHHCRCRIPHWIAERGNTIHRLACEPGRNVAFKTAWQGFLFSVGFPAIPRRVTLFLLYRLGEQKWSECWGNGCRGAAWALQAPVCQQLHPTLRGWIVCVVELNRKKDLFSHQWDGDWMCKGAFLCSRAKAELSSEEWEG